MFAKGYQIPIREIQKLIAGCLIGDRACQRKIYDVYSPAMMALSLRYSKNREEAEEILQDGFLLMFKNIGQFKNAGSFEGWLRRIMINCALQRYRNNIHRFTITSISEDQDSPSAQLDQLDRLSEKELIRIIQKLPPGYRMVFNLYVFEGMKHREIAMLLNITVGTSKSNLSDARNILRKQITAGVSLTK
jgi:RNA polymerase sigma factor (sigma-70 family)